MANQRDVADRAGVSSASVSRYLTNPDSVKEATAARIAEAIKELKYRPDYFARSLKTGRSNHIGILLPGFGPFYWEILQGMEDRLTRAGYFTTTFYTRDVETYLPSSRDELSSFLENKLIEGVVYFPLSTAEDSELFEQLKSLHEHIVVVDRDMKDEDVDQVLIDGYEAGRTAARAFLGLGHTEFLYIDGTAESYSALERKDGFRAGLRESGLDLDENRVLRGNFTSKSVHDLTVTRWSELPPFTAVFAVNDSSAMGFMRAAVDRGCVCPRDYSIIGFDNNVEFAPYITPSLSSFQQPLPEVGVLAAERLIGQFEADLPAKHIVLQAQFVKRESLAQAPD